MHHYHRLSNAASTSESFAFDLRMHKWIASCENTMTLCPGLDSSWCIRSTALMLLTDCMTSPTSSIIWPSFRWARFQAAMSPSGRIPLTRLLHPLFVNASPPLVLPWIVREISPVTSKSSHTGPNRKITWFIMIDKFNMWLHPQPKLMLHVANAILVLSVILELNLISALTKIRSVWCLCSIPLCV